MLRRVRATPLSGDGSSARAGRAPVGDLAQCQDRGGEIRIIEARPVPRVSPLTAGPYSQRGMLPRRPPRPTSLSRRSTMRRWRTARGTPIPSSLTGIGRRDGARRSTRRGSAPSAATARRRGNQRLVDRDRPRVWSVSARREAGAVTRSREASYTVRCTHGTHFPHRWSGSGRGATCNHCTVFAGFRLLDGEGYGRGRPVSAVTPFVDEMVAATCFVRAAASTAQPNLAPGLEVPAPTPRGESWDPTPPASARRSGRRKPAVQRHCRPSCKRREKEGSQACDSS